MDTDSQAGGERTAKKETKKCMQVLMKLHVPFVEIGFAHFLQSTAPKKSHAPFWVVQIVLETKMISHNHML